MEFWTVTNYSRGLSLREFTQQYASGVYRYRLIGKGLVLAVYQLLAQYLPETTLALPHDPSASYLLCLSLALVNGACLFAANLVLIGLLWVRHRGIDDVELAGYMFYMLLLALSLVVVTPYDQMAYLLLLVGMTGARMKTEVPAMALVAVSAVVGTLNRETEFLLSAWLATLAIFSAEDTSRRYWRLLGVSASLSVATYVGLRMWMPGQADVILGVTMGGKWGVESLIVVGLLLCVTAALAMRLCGDVRPLLTMLALSTPYLVTILLGGTLRELRLTVPVVLSSLLLYVQFSRDETHRQTQELRRRDTISRHI